MKRRRLSSTSDDRDPPRFHPLGETSRMGFHGGRSSEDRSGEETRRGEPEIAIRRRVTFAGLEEDSSSCRDGDYCRHEAESTKRRSDQPKTSEYAFFQKLKEGPSRRINSHPLHVEKNQPEKFECRGDHRCESYGVVHGSNKKPSSSRLTESDLPPKYDSFVHPLDTSSEKSDPSHAPTTAPNIFFKEKSVDGRNASGIWGAPGRSDVFFRKRENLLHLLRNTSPEIDELFMKGPDFLPSLLSRLSGKGNKNSIFKTHDVAQIRAADTKGKAVNFNPVVDVKEFRQSPTEEPRYVGVETCWGCDSSSTWPSKSTERIFSACDSPSAYRIVPWSETIETDYTSSKNIRDIVPYAKSDAALDFPAEVGETVSFNFPRNVENFPDSNTNGPFLNGQYHTPLLQWNFAKDERDWITACPLEEATRDHFLSLNFRDTDRHHRIIGGCSGTNSFLALPPIENSRTERQFEMGFGEDLAAAFNHRRMTLSYSPSHFPEEWIHDYLSEMVYHLKPDEYEDDMFTHGQHHQCGIISSAPHPGFGSDSSSKFLLPWDPSKEAKLSLHPDLQFPHAENVISSLFPGKHGWEKLMEEALGNHSSGCSHQSIVEYPLFQFHSSFQFDASNHFH